MIDNMETLVEYMNKSSDSLINWINQIKQSSQFNIDDLK